MEASYSETTYNHDRLLASDAPVVVRKVTLITGQNVVRGAVLGQITASLKVNLSLSAAADGSQTPRFIAAEAKDATAGDKEILVYERADVNENALTLGAAHTIASIREGLRGLGIHIVKAAAR